MKAPSVVEVCAGAGGFALGLERAGWRALALVEREALRCQVLRRNRPEWPVHQADMRTWAWGGERPDLLAGGVPCQPSSRAGGRRLDQDERDLWKDLPALIERVSPRRAVCFENVPGVADNPSVRALSNWLSARGWGWTWWKCHAERYGVPQTRERWFFVAIRGAGVLMPEGPLPTYGGPGQPPVISIAEALGDDYGHASTLPEWLEKRLPEGMGGGCLLDGQNVNKGFSFPSSRARFAPAPPQRIQGGLFNGKADNGRRRLRQGGGGDGVLTKAGKPSAGPKQHRDLSEPAFTVTAKCGRRHRIVLVGGHSGRNGDPLKRTADRPAPTVCGGKQKIRLMSMNVENALRSLDGPAPTITASRHGPRIIDDREVWALGERQLQRLQAFPDDWRGMTADMIGDAVPPPLAEAVGRRLLEVLG